MSTPHLDCHVCRTPLPPEDLSQSHGMAFCRRCQTLIRLDRYQPPRYQSPMVTTGLRPQVELPKGWSIQWTAEELCIAYRWFSLKKLLASTFCLFLFIWSIWFILPANVIRHNPRDLVDTWLFLLVCLGFGLLSAYVTLANLLNTTTITVKQGCLTVVHAPLPWWHPPPLRTADITQLFVRRVIQESRYGSHKFYEVWAQLRQGREVKLMYGLEAPEQALFIEQQLEMFLGITDRPVPGELERR